MWSRTSEAENTEEEIGIGRGTRIAGRRGALRQISGAAYTVLRLDDMMCTCGHGSDRHYLDYAGPGVCGGVLGKCLEKDCECKKFEEKTETYTPTSTIWTPTFSWPTNR